MGLFNRKRVAKVKPRRGFATDEWEEISNRTGMVVDSGKIILRIEEIESTNHLTKIKVLDVTGPSRIVSQAKYEWNGQWVDTDRINWDEDTE